jgi:hypothetical protein
MEHEIDENFARIHELLLRLTRAQDSATFHGESSADVILLVEKTTHEIVGMFKS